MKKIKNGFFITVEGIDGSGKSSVVNFLSSALANLHFSVIKTREPGGTKLGVSLRNIIIGAAAEPGALGPLGLGNFARQYQQREAKLEHINSDAIDMKAEFLLFAADRAQHIGTLIKPNLEQGAIIISDRGSDSSLAYQGYGKGLDLEMISSINNWVMEKTKPDLVIYLKIDYKTAIDRVMARGEKITSFEKRGRDFFDKVINGFNEIFYLRSQQFPATVMEVDASQSAEAVKKEVLEKVLQIISLKELI